MRQALKLLGAASLIVAAWAAGAAGQDANRAQVIVSVPADAAVYFDGTLMKQTGTTRTYSTPPLTPGTDFSYAIKALFDRDGHPVSVTHMITIRAGQTVRVDFNKLGAGVPNDETPPDIWPRKFTQDGLTLTVYQPQLEKWEQNRLEARAAVSVENQASPQPTFGVAHLAARTEVDKEHRQVTLEDLSVTGAEFPAAGDRAASYLAALRKAAPTTARTIALDRLQANLAVTQAESKTARPEVKNEAPRVIYSTRPSILVLVDGQPALRQVDAVTMLRVINTRALLMFDEANSRYYLHVFDRWMQAGSLEGPWSAVEKPPASLQTVADKFGDDPQVDMLDELASDLKDVFNHGDVPPVYVSTVPAELIETDGKPALEPVPDTKLLWIKNSKDQILLNTEDNNYYALFSGRWFRSKSLENGPWEFVRADKLPADFAKVPETHPRGDMLASVAGTPQAQEAALAHQVPQTATIDRSQARLETTYDGNPQFQPIEGTQLQYATNSPTPVIQVDPASYYACENGVWFNSATATGPWAAATSVPPAIYSIPPSSPIYYVTQVYTYGYTPEYVYTGYLPGYCGAYLCPENVLVYGTGWAWRPWLGRYWYGRPWTYGWGVRVARTPVGWGYGYAAGVGRPWWGPVGWNAAWGGAAWRAGWERGYGGRFAGAHVNNINYNNFNVYNRWGNNVHLNAARNTVVANRSANVVANRQTNIASAQRNLNNVVAGRDGNAYRRAGEGWERHDVGGWSRVDANRLSAAQRTDFNNVSQRLNQDWGARRAGEANFNSFRAASANASAIRGAGGYGGYHGGAGGFRGGGGGRR